MERKHEAISIACHNFSDIRRRPLVIGKLDQVRLPFVVTMPQLAVGAITFALLFLTRPAWGAVMSDRLHIVVFVVVPVLMAQQVSRTSVEGRTVSKATLAFLRLWLAPRQGSLNGRRRREMVDEHLRLQPLLERPADPTRRSRRHRTDRRGRNERPSQSGRPTRRERRSGTDKPSRRARSTRIQRRPRRGRAESRVRS